MANKKNAFNTYSSKKELLIKPKVDEFGMTESVALDPSPYYRPTTARNYVAPVFQLH